MAKASRTTASQVEEAPGYEGRFEELGGYTVAFERYSQDSDLAPLFRGLPDDACQCPHWGLVLKGAVTYRYSDGSTEEYHEGDAYYARPGHTPFLHAGGEVVEFSPTDDLGRTLEVVTRNIQAMQAQA